MYHVHPITGAPLHLADLIKLTFYRNVRGNYQCPILQKIFNQHSHIVAIRISGNVYCYEAIEKLNFETKAMCDLITGETFKRSEIIIIQNPLDQVSGEFKILETKVHDPLITESNTL